MNLAQICEDEMNIRDKQGNMVVKPCSVPQGNQIDVILAIAFAFFFFFLISRLQVGNVCL